MIDFDAEIRVSVVKIIVDLIFEIDGKGRYIKTALIK